MKHDHPSTPPTSEPKPEGNILVTNASGLAMYANDGIAKRTRFSVAEIIDSKPGKLWGGRMPRAFYDRMWQTIRDEAAPFSGIATNETKDGKRYEELLAIVPLKQSTGETRYLALSPPEHSGTREQFLSEWGKVFRSPGVTVKTALPWLRRWFPMAVSAAQPTTGRFSDWIEQTWVAPLRQRFQSRTDDQALVATAKVDRQAFRLLYEKHYPVVRKYFSQHLAGQADQIEDLTQDTFIRAFERLEGYEARNAAYSTYLLRIAHNLLLNSYRRKDALELMLDFPSPTAERAVASELGWIWETPELSHEERVVLSAYYREGYSVREIGVGLQKSENAVKLMLSRARKKIRPLLSSA